ncbi:MAG: PAS domain S-box protein, partial [Kiloniellales bacterium]|nr:PAS domain S-box protein [Kiloniellales bacterium]
MILDFACPIPPAEEEEARLLALASYGIVDTPAEAEFDRFVRLASELFEVPIAVISLVERDRQWFKAIVGLEASETERQVSFCGHAILSDDPLVVPNALEDPRFKGNPLVVGAPNIRFYAGAPLITPTGARLGTLCIIDDKPRSGFTDCQATLLADLAQLVMDRLELRKAEAERRISQERFRKIASTTPEAIVCADFEGTIQFWNEAAESIFGYLKEDALGRNVAMLVPEESQSAHQSGMERFVTGGTPRLIGQTREFMARRRDG